MVQACPSHQSIYQESRAGSRWSDAFVGVFKILDSLKKRPHGSKIKRYQKAYNILNFLFQVAVVLLCSKFLCGFPGTSPPWANRCRHTQRCHISTCGHTASCPAPWFHYIFLVIAPGWCVKWVPSSLEESWRPAYLPQDPKPSHLTSE